MYFPPSEKQLLFVIKRLTDRYIYIFFKVWKACLSPAVKDEWSMEVRVTEGGRREGGTRAQ